MDAYKYYGYVCINMAAQNRKYYRITRSKSQKLHFLSFFFKYKLYDKQHYNEVMLYCRDAQYCWFFFNQKHSQYNGIIVLLLYEPSIRAILKLFMLCKHMLSVKTCPWQMCGTTLENCNFLVVTMQWPLTSTPCNDVLWRKITTVRNGLGHIILSSSSNLLYSYLLW